MSSKSNEAKPIDVRVIPRKSTKKTPARDESAASRGGGIKSEAEDELSQCFKGDVLLDLHELGVSAFNANELERNGSCCCVDAETCRRHRPTFAQ